MNYMLQTAEMIKLMTVLVVMHLILKFARLTFVESLVEKKSVRRPRRRCEDTTRTNMNHQNYSVEYVDCTQLA
jgi:hypothetical protein